MKPGHWQRIDQLFHAALDCTPEERSAFLDEACVGDETLRKEVESLLSAGMKAGSFIEKPALELEAQALASNQSVSVTGRAVGRYLIESSIGKGAMGEVYLAQDMQLGRKVALKFLPAEFTKDSDRVRRFQQEARAASALNHPNIITIHEIDKAEGRHFIVTEFVAGETLRQRIKTSHLHSSGNKGNFVVAGIPVGEVLRIGMQIADALATAHEKGIVHRDIKPENIMLVRSSQLFQNENFVKLLDFGIAKLTSKNEAVTADATTAMLVDTQEGRAVGTAVYMSPEQARGGRVDGRTDIWSLGIVLYEMLSACQPFGGGTVQDVIASILKEEAPPLPAGTPDRLRLIIGKTLRKDRDQRYQTMKELFLDLENLAKALESKSEIDTRRIDKVIEPQRETPRVNGPTKQIERNHQRVVIVAAGLLLVPLIIGAYLYTKSLHRTTIKSLAVVPFVNANGDADLEYLAEGMTDSLINSLSQLPDLAVKPRSAVSRYKGKEVEPQRIAFELSVEAVVGGRIIRQGDNLILSLYLADGRDGNQRWGQQYEGKVTDLVSLRRQVARDVSLSLRAGLSGAEEQKVMRDHTENSQALGLYYSGRYQVFKLKAPEVKEGISLLQQAIQIDPNFALAYVGLSDANASLGIACEMKPAEFLPKSKEAAQRAIGLDDGLAEAHVALGRAMFWYDWNWHEAENEYKRALELNPNNADAHQFYAHLLSNTGRHLEALAEIRRARELNRFGSFTNALEGLFLDQAGKPDEALASLSETVKLDPGFWLPHLFASSAYIDKGMFTEALAEARRAKELNGMQTRSIALEGYILAKLGKHAEAQAALDELLKLSEKGFVPPTHIALLYNGMGNRPQTLAWLQRGFNQHDPKMAFLKVEHIWNNLRDDAQFADLIRRLEFPE